MSIATETQRILNAKAAIKTAIEAKGVTVGTAKLDAYASKIDLIDEWIMPNDWINIGDVADNEILLLASDVNPYYSFSVTVVGGYTINWGDGNVINYASSAVATHEYTVGVGQVCSRGYTTFKIRIYAQTPANPITLFSIGKSKDIYDLYNGLLWAKIGTIGLTTATTMFYNSTAFFYNYSHLIESIELPNSLSSCTSFAGIANYAWSLRKIRMPFIYNSSVNISFSNAFSDCISLTKINFNVSSLKASSFQNTFLNCSNLKKVTLPSTITGCSSFASCFQSNLSLQEIVLPTTIDTNCSCSAMFNVTRLKELIFPSTFEGRITDLATVVGSNTTLKKVVFPSTLATTGQVNAAISSICIGCSSLEEVTLPTNISTQITASAPFLNCYNLKTINNLPNLSQATNILQFSQACFSLNAPRNSNGDYMLDTLGDTTTGIDHSITFTRCYSFTRLYIRNKNIGRFVLTGLDASNLGKLTSLLFTNPSAVSTWAGASPQIDVSYQPLDTIALNALFTSIIATQDPAMPTGKTIRITGCTGANTCDTTILTTGGKWTVNKTT